MNASNDRDLVIAFQAGDPLAYSFIDRKYRPIVSRVCRRMLRNTQDAEDAIQEIMIRVLRGLGTFNGQYRLEAWVSRVAQNHCLDVIRKTQRQPVVVTVTEDSDTELHYELRLDDPGEIAERHVERDEVHITLGQIPDHHRTALVMREWAGASHEEIAAALGTTPPRAKALIHRAKQSFREVWAERSWAMRALLPIFFIRRLMDVIRKVPAERADLAGTPVASVAVAATTPAAAPLVSAVSERMVAAATAMVVAASTLGAGVAVQQSRQEPPPKQVVQRLVVEETPSASASIATAEPTAATSTEMSPEASPLTSESAEPSASPSESPATSPSTSPSGSPSSSPSPSPSGSSSPTPTPTESEQPPRYALDFVTSTPSEDSCVCDPRARLLDSQVSGKAGGTVRFSQVVEGAALDSQGDAVWPYDLRFSGSAEGSSGTIRIEFSLRYGDLTFEYSGSGTLRARSTASGETSYEFAGTYDRLTTGAENQAPPSGSFTMSHSWWKDARTLYDVQLMLED